MSIYEFDEERHNRALREEGRAEGREEGRAEGREDILQIAISKGMLTPEQANELRSTKSTATA